MLINNAVLTGSFTVNGVNYITNTPSTGSNTFVGTQIISGSTLMTGSLGVTGSVSVSGSITATGTLTAQTLVVQTITSSIVYSSGSNIFGNAIANTQTFTGSVLVTGSLALVGNITSNGTAVVLGSGTSNYLPKFTGASTIGNSQIFDNGTNVGIGTASPQSALSFPTTSHIGLATTDASDNGYLSIGGGGGGGDTRGAGMYMSGNERTTYGGQLAIFAGNAGASGFINFNTGGSEKMRLDASGSLGLGTVSPENILTLIKNTTAATENTYGLSIQSVNTNAYTELLLGASDAVDAGIIQTAAKNTNFTAKNLSLQPQGGNVGIGTTAPNYTLHIDSNTTLTRFQITNSTTGQGGGVGLQIIQDGLNTSLVNRSNGYMSFETVGTERMRLTNSGSVLIGTTTDFSTGYKLQVSSGNIRHYQNNENCEFAHNGDMTIANGGTKTLSCANGGLVFVSENNTGDGALFFCGYKSATIILIADPNNRYAATDTAGKGCLYKSANTGVVTFKNNLGSSLSFTMYQIKNSD